LFWKWRRNAKTEASIPDNGTEAITCGNGRENIGSNVPSKHTFQACVSRSIRKFPHLAPKDASAEAYVAFLRANGSTGEHLQGDLYDAYHLLCVASSFTPIPWKQFGKEMRKAGCSRRQGDISDGARSKPMMITIPPEGEIGRQMMDWESPKGPSRKRTAKIKRAETKRKLVASM
jgi:hypothetical protein